METTDTSQLSPEERKQGQRCRVVVKFAEVSTVGRSYLVIFGIYVKLMLRIVPSLAQVKCYIVWFIALWAL